MQEDGRLDVLDVPYCQFNTTNGDEDDGETSEVSINVGKFLN